MVSEKQKTDTPMTLDIKQRWNIFTLMFELFVSNFTELR